MAEGGISDKESGRDEIFHFLCSVCKAHNKKTEAGMFCCECHDYYCSSCVKCHKDIPVLKDHKILDAAHSQLGSNSQLPAVPTEKCKVHKHKPVDMYCKNHDVVVCSTCMLMKHSSCNRKFYVPDYVKDTSEAANSKDVEEDLDNVTKFLNELHEAFIKEKKELKDSKDRSLKEIRLFRDEINQLLDQFEEKTVQKLENKFQAQKDNINAKLEELQASTAEVKAAQDSMNSAKSAGRNIPQLFVSIKQANEVISQANMKINITISQSSHGEIHYLANEMLRAVFDEVNVLGSISLIKKIQIAGSKEYPVKMKSEAKPCHITSACLLENGTIILADSSNSKVKLIDSSSYNVTDCCEVPLCAWQVCAITDTEVAVSCKYSSCIQFVKVGRKMKKTRQIKTDIMCIGLAFADESLFVSDKTSVFMFSLSGEQLLLYNDQYVDGLFYDITALVVSSDVSRFYVTDSKNGLMVLGINLKPVGQYNGDKLRAARGVCRDNNGNVFVCGSSSKNALQFSPDGTLIGEVLKTDESCTAVCCKNNNSELIIGFFQKDYIQVYSIND